MSDLEAHLRKFRRELSSGTVSLALLAILAAEKEAMYGYQIAKRFERDGDGVLVGKQSSLYPVLRNLEGGGLLASYVAPSDTGPPRRYYRITVQGREVLHEWRAAWTSTRDFVESALEDVK
ncbi:MAG: PadR family transcriptional regulator [Rhodanobacter sp.]